MLEETKPCARTGYLLPDMAEKYLRHSSLVTERTRQVFEAAGIKTQDRPKKGRARVLVGFHSLRHTFVSLAGNAGVPLAVVQSFVGHGNPMMTAHYFHESGAATQRAIDALPPVETIAAADHAEVAPEAETRLQAFKAAFDALTADECEAALRWIDGRRGE